MKIIKNIMAVALLLFTVVSINAQSFLKKKEIKAYKCGYIHKESFLNKMKPMKLISKATGAFLKAKPKSDLNKTAIQIGYASGLIPKSQVDFATKTPGWETCGEGVSLIFFNYNGIGFTDTDGSVKVNGTKLEKAGMGTYFKGFSKDERGNQKIEVESSNGDKLSINLEPAAALEIVSINGVPKGGDIVIDGKEDIVIELKGGNADPDSELFVEMIVSAMSLKVPTHLYPSKASNKIIVPKEALKNFETSPLPIVKKNTISVTRVKHDLLYNTDAAVVQTVTTFSDFTPVLFDGDFAGGNLLKNAFTKDKNTQSKDAFTTIEGEYNVNVNKGNPYRSPPTSRMKNIGISSFVVRGNLFKEKTTTRTTSNTNYYTGIKTTTTYTNTLKKWFPEMSDADWQKFINVLYKQFEKVLKEENINVIPVEQILATKAYKDMKPIADTVTKTFVEKGAFGTKRLIKTGALDALKDMKTTFPSDYTNEKIIRELNLDGLITVTLDLDFDLETGGLNPVLKLVAFAPNVNYRTLGEYFQMDFSTKAKNLKEVNKYTSATGPGIIIYKVMKGDDLVDAFRLGLKRLKEDESKKNNYSIIWRDRN